jgi:hypothetical protein
MLRLIRNPLIPKFRIFKRKKYMNIFLYLDKGTWIHRLDPRTKIMGVLIVFVICLCFNHPLYMAAISLGVMLTAISAKALANFWRYLFLFTPSATPTCWQWPSNPKVSALNRNAHSTTSLTCAV